MSENRLWTLQIRGPEPFTFQTRGNPSVEHEGGVTVAQQVLTLPEVGELKIYAAAAGCKVTAWPTEGQSAIQAEERTRFMGLGEPDRTWATPECPLCPWFDPFHEGSSCSLTFAPAESIEVLRETSETHREAEASCSLRGAADDGQPVNSSE